MKNPTLRKRLKILKRVAGPGPVLILTHDNPDPDAFASGTALATLFREAWDIPSRLVYSGIVGRAENRAILKLLASEWEHAEKILDLEGYKAIALVDSQPGAGNNSLPVGFIPHIVIDHHTPLREATKRVLFTDIRTDIGATVSIVYQYLELAGVEVSADLATAMFLGIRSDTDGLVRGALAEDGKIYVKLLESVDREKLIEVEQAGLSREYFRAFYRGFQTAQIVGETITAWLGEMHRPDLVAEMADLLIRLEDVHTAFCIGLFHETLYFSLRVGNPIENAGLLVQKMIIPPGHAGGHGATAGGQIPLAGRDINQLVKSIQDQFFDVMGESGHQVSLLSN